MVTIRSNALSFASARLPDTRSIAINAMYAAAPTMTTRTKPDQSSKKIAAIW